MVHFLNPNYRGVWEGEEQSAWLDVSPRLRLGHSASSTDTTDEQDSDITLSVSTEGSFKNDLGSRTFFFAGGGGDIYYQHRRGTDSDEDSYTRSSGDIHFQAVRVGIGMGRVRIVTPVIRALRVRERLHAVPQTRLSDEQVQTAARQLARRPGYESVYDRPDKFFWRDFFENVGATDQTPFDTKSGCKLPV